MRCQKLSLLFLTVAVVTSCSTPPEGRIPAQSAKQKIVGTWSSVDDPNDEVWFTFFADGKMQLASKNMRVGDPSKSQPYLITYSLDLGTTPWGLDIVATKNGAYLGLARCILELIDDNTIRIGVNPKKAKDETPSRPDGFALLAEDMIGTLKRVEMPQPTFQKRPVYPVSLRKLGNPAVSEFVTSR